MLLPIVIGAAALGFIAMKRRRRCHGPAGGCGGGRHGRRRRGWRRGLYWGLARLGTTPGQEKVIREELGRLRELGWGARGELFDARGDLADLLRGEALDQAQLDVVVGRLDGAYTTLKAAALESLRRVHDTLDSHQREQLAEFLGRKRGPRTDPFRT